MPGDLEVIERDGLARIARYSTSHGVIETPTLMPVINPNLPVISIDEMKKLGAQSFITNSYIIKRSENLMGRALKYGVHSLIGFDGPIMTDSGTFQTHVYSDMEYTNAEIVEFQKEIGSDIITILDIFSEPNFSHEKAEWAVKETYRRVMEIGDTGESILAGPVQGSTYPDLRRYSSELMSSSRAGYLPIGGIVPLLEAYRYDATVEIIINSKIRSNFSKPIHLFGGGHPMFLPLAVLLGVDFFDSASYIKYAKDGRMLFSNGSKELTKISSLPRWSPLYGKYTVKELIELPEGERIRELSRHNLSAIFNEMEEIRESIHEQSLWNYVESRSRAHPMLFRAYLKILEYRKEIEKFQELSKKTSFFYYDSYSSMTPTAERLNEFTRDLVASSNRTYMLPDYKLSPGFSMSGKHLKLYETTDGAFLTRWNGTCVPVELESTYPVEQVISAYNDHSLPFSELENVPGPCKGIKAIPVEEFITGERVRDYLLEKIRRIADYQFGMGVGLKMFDDTVTVTVSKNTGRIRSVISNGTILATLRAKDGFFTLSIHGALLLLDALDFPRHRVMVNSESAPYNSKGYNVFFKFILDNDPGILAGNEVLVVDGDDNLLACGKSSVSGKELHEYRKGVAVNVVHSVSEIGEKPGI